MDLRDRVQSEATEIMKNLGYYLSISEGWDVLPGEEKAQGDFSTYANILLERLEKMEPDYSQCYPVTGQE